MGKPTADFPILRVVVALEPSRQSLAALNAAIKLAASLEVELLGLFVEDINLLRLAELPFARETGYLLGQKGRLDLLSMQRALRAQATLLRKLLAGAAERAQVRYTFQTVRGRVTQELLSAARETDLLIVGRACASRTGPIPLGSTALAIARGAPQTVLVVQRGVPFRQPLLVAYDGSENSDRVLAAAARLSRGSRPRILLLVVAGDAKEAARLRSKALRRLKRLGLEIHYQSLTVRDLRALVNLVKRRGEGTLLLGAQNPLLEGDKFQEVLRQIEINVLLIR